MSPLLSTTININGVSLWVWYSFEHEEADVEVGKLESLDVTLEEVYLHGDARHEKDLLALIVDSDLKERVEGEIKRDLNESRNR